MTRCSISFGRAGVAAAGLASLLVACSDNDSVTNNSATPVTEATETRLVADVSGFGAAAIDPNLVNPWGLAFGPTGILWVANNGSGTSTLYDSTGASRPTVVTIPSAEAGTPGVPTGVIYNGTTDFTIPGAATALFIYAGEDGTISAWGAATGNAVLVANRSSTGAVYKGIAMASSQGVNFLYATNFKNNEVDVFNGSFQFTTSFTDPAIPAGYGPFGIQTIGGELYVTYAKQLAPDDHDDQPGVGNGYIDIFNPDGTLARRFASNGRLNSPWGVVMAPAGFGSVGGDILVGNFGDGLIGAYDPNTGNLVTVLEDPTGATLSIDGLWALTFGPAAGSTTLYFSAGPNSESHGLLGTLKAVQQ